MNRRELLCSAGGVAALGFANSAIASSDPLSSDGSIRIGQSAVFTGPSAALGKEMKQGMDAAFLSVNRAGGIHGRKIQLVSYDDGYEPDRALANAQRLAAEGVFGFCGFVGTPTSMKVLPFVSSADIPFVGAFTGASGLRTPMNRNVFNCRAGYDDEAPVMVKQLTAFSDQTRIALFVQDDGYGAAVRHAMELALNARGLPAPVLVAKVPRNASQAQLDEVIPNLVGQMIAAGVRGVACGSVYSACVRLAEEFQTRKFFPMMASVSFVGTSYLVNCPSDAVVGMGVTQVMPRPTSPTSRFIQEYYTKAMLDAGQTDLTYGSVEGVLAALTFVSGLRRAGPNPTREKFRAAMEKPLLFGDFALDFSPNNHNGSRFVDVVAIVNKADGVGKRVEG
jgi:branched-chain amino acid transport system substrate-binding protein